MKNASTEANGNVHSVMVTIYESLEFMYGDLCHDMEWHIPLLDIGQSAKILMRKDAGFKKRLVSNALTMTDVERLFMEVTYGIIELEPFEGY